MVSYSKIDELAINAIDNSSILNKSLVKNKYIESAKLAGMYELGNIEMQIQDLLPYINNFINSINCYTGHQLSVKMVPTESNTSENPDYKSLLFFSKIELLNSLPDNLLSTVHLVKKTNKSLMLDTRTIIVDYIKTLVLNITNAVNPIKVNCIFDYIDYYNSSFTGFSATNTIENLMTIYKHVLVSNAGAANIGVIFYGSKSGSFSDPSSGGKGSTTFVCWPDSGGNGYMFMTPCDSGFDPFWGGSVKYYSSYAQAQEALKKKVITVNF